MSAGSFAAGLGFGFVAGLGVGFAAGLGFDLVAGFGFDLVADAMRHLHPRGERPPPRREPVLRSISAD